MANKTAPDSARRSEKSRRAIYDAALALIGEVGYQKTTIEGIAARAGVGKQTIYRWWSSKAEVLLEAFIDLSARAADAAARPEVIGERAEYEIPDTGDLEADLKAVLRATVDELLAVADRLMYDGKRAGKDSVRYLTSESGVETVLN